MGIRSQVKLERGEGVFEPVLNKSVTFFFYLPIFNCSQKVVSRKKLGGDLHPPSPPSYVYDIITLGCIPKIFSVEK